MRSEISHSARLHHLRRHRQRARCRLRTSRVTQIVNGAPIIVCNCGSRKSGEGDFPWVLLDSQVVLGRHTQHKPTSLRSAFPPHLVSLLGAGKRSPRKADHDLCSGWHHRSGGRHLSPCEAAAYGLYPQTCSTSLLESCPEAFAAKRWHRYPMARGYDHSSIRAGFCFRPGPDPGE